MQTLQFTRALRTIVEQLKVSETIEFLHPLISPGNTSAITDATKNRFAALLFGAYSGYERLTNDPTISQILVALEIAKVYETARMGKLISLLPIGGQAQSIWGSPTNFAEFFGFYELLRSISKLENTCTELLERQRLGGAEESEDVLEIQLLDYNSAGIEPERMRQFVSTLEQLHTDLARIKGASGRLSILYLDSGSDVVTGLRCAKGVAETLKTLMSEFWDRIIYKRYDEFGKHLNAISSSLSVVTDIQSAVTKGSLTLEEGEILKARILRGLENLTAIGASLPFRREHTEIDHRKLLVDRRDERLLGDGKDGIPDASTQGT